MELGYKLGKHENARLAFIVDPTSLGTYLASIVVLDRQFYGIWLCGVERIVFTKVIDAIKCIFLTLSSFYLQHRG